MRLLLISGHAQNGKDTLAGFLKNELENIGNKVLIAHYADLLKYFCKDMFGWNGEKDESGRTLLQKVGTDMVRKNDPDFWVCTLLKFLKYCDGEWDYGIIPDCRFKNEIYIAMEYFPESKHIRIYRDIDNGLTKSQSEHISENDLNDYSYDYLFDNNGTLEELERTAQEWVESNLSC